MLDMRKCRRSQCKDRRADLRIRNYLNSEDVGQTRAAVVAKRTKDKVFAFLIENKDTGDHCYNTGVNYRRAKVWDEGMDFMRNENVLVLRCVILAAFQTGGDGSC